MLSLVTSVVEVVFIAVSAFVCISVCKMSHKIYKQISMKFLEELGVVQGTRAGLRQSVALFQLRIRVNLRFSPTPLSFPSPPLLSPSLPSSCPSPP